MGNQRHDGFPNTPSPKYCNTPESQSRGPVLGPLILTIYDPRILAVCTKKKAPGLGKPEEASSKQVIPLGHSLYRHSKTHS